ncbi:MAG: hypothetical protein IK081_00455 [Lachnospiraceae bacterium]|nr:hypothetical protein [Lachnospiraceae bacterium]
MMRFFGKERRILSMITAAAVVCCVLFMFSFMAYESGHECSGEDCEICFCLDACIQLVNNVKDGAVLAGFLCVLAAIFGRKPAAADDVFGIGTPVSRRVRLNI